MKNLNSTQTISVIYVIFVFIYLGWVSFFKIPDAGAEFAKTIVPFLLSGVIGIVMNFYYGNKDEQKTSPAPAFPKMDEAVKAETEKLQAAQVEAVKTDTPILNNAAPTTMIDLINQQKG